MLLGFPLDNILFLVDVHVHDSMHGVFVDGVFTHDGIKCFVHAREHFGDVYAWLWVSSLYGRDTRLQMRANELLSLFNVLAFFVLRYYYLLAVPICPLSAWIARWLWKAASTSGGTCQRGDAC